MKKLRFRNNSPRIAYLLLLFTERAKIQKFEIFKYSRRRLWDPIAGCPGDQMMGRSRDVHGTSVKHDFQIQKRFKFILTGYSRIYSEW